MSPLLRLSLPPYTKCSLHLCQHGHFIHVPIGPAQVVSDRDWLMSTSQAIISVQLLASPPRWVPSVAINIQCVGLHTLCPSYSYSRVPLLVSSFPLLLFLGQLIKPFATARGPAHILCRATLPGSHEDNLKVSRYQCQLRHCMTLKSLAIPLSPVQLPSKRPWSLRGKE